jgi:hypothetical protein
MDFFYDDRLVEEAVVREIEARRRSGDRQPYETYHEMTDSLYSLLTAADRSDAFRRAHLYFFTRFGFKPSIEMAVQGRPRLNTIARVMVRPAQKNEFADLSVTDQGLALLLEIRLDTLADASRLHSFMRRELTLVDDMLDPEFKHGRDLPPGLNPSQELLFRDRYGFLWRTYVDARLVCAGLEPSSIHDRRRDEFRRMYGSLPPAVADKIFETVWTRDRFTHPEFVELALSLEKLLALAGISGSYLDSAAPIPGSPCPLCRFPTHHWALLNGQGERVEREVQKDFPQWRLDHGLCERCGELYSLRVI